jgi:DNA-binding XRE family transcriptional regulator
LTKGNVYVTLIFEVTYTFPAFAKRIIKRTMLFGIGEKMRDYILKVDKDLEIVIEKKQKDVRNDVISQYILCRKSLQMTQTDIANVLGTKRPNITRFENGTYNPTLDFLVKVAESMGKELEIKLVDKTSL